MSDDDYKGLANILRVAPTKKKAPVLTKEELEFEEEMDEFFAPSEQNLWPVANYKKNK